MLASHAQGSVTPLPTSAEEQTLLAIAVEAARTGGALVRDAFARPRVGVATKSSDTDVVTATDRASEDAIRAVIVRARPDDAFLGEESGQVRGRTGLRWVVDPLDGTVNFLYGIPQFSVSIACEDASGAVVGVVYDPLREEMFTAARGGGAACNGTAITVRADTEIARALIATGFSYVAAERETAAAMLRHILPRVGDIRRVGGAALDLAYVAAGRIDGYYEAPLKPWDSAAGALLVAEAGGRVSVMEPIGPTGPGVIAASPAIFDALRDLVAHARATYQRAQL